ncbi:MAG TPA: hypothetical protein VNA20_14620 [Frankiaceae bacterium]|nr:hypothetical protein [Frankiaceae bacterium]
MRESYVRPVTSASEPRPEWIAAWRFRLVMFVLLVAVGAATAWGVNLVLHAADQDPVNIDEPAPTTAPQGPLPES